MPTSVHQGDLHVNGTLTSKALIPPNSSVSNNTISPTAAIDTSKMRHRHVITYTQPLGAEVVAATDAVYVCRPAEGSIVGVRALVTGVVATGADRTIEVDVLRGKVGVAPATVLTAPITLDDDSDLLGPVAATIADDEFSVDDVLIVEVSVAGAAGDQAEGLLVEITIDEDAQ